MTADIMFFLSAEAITFDVGKLAVPPVMMFSRMDNNAAAAAVAVAPGRRAGNKNCTRDEVLNLLGLMEQTLPIGPDKKQLH